MNGVIPERVLQYGRDEPLAEQIPLRAGPLTMILESGGLRYIRWGRREVIRRIYAAVRDRNWGTVPGQLRDLQVEAGPDSFRVRYHSDHVQGAIAFSWAGQIEGDPDGTIRFHFEGTARTSFFKNRLGFCVLHPMEECAGGRCRVERADGTIRDTAFPRLIAAEQPVGEIYDLQALAHEVEPGRWAELRFAGDLFELEDQRNWIDASFKTFCTPLRLPFPVEIKAGQTLSQSVTLRVFEADEPGKKIAQVPQTPAPSAASGASEPIRLRVARDGTRQLVQIGLGVSSFQERYPAEAIRRLRALRLSHLRAELALDSPDFARALEQAEWEAQALDLPLEVALTMQPDEDLRSIVAWAERRVCLVARWLILTEGEDSTTHECLAIARTRLRGLGAIGVGTGADFYQLNQSRPLWHNADFVAWSVNPQVHAFDLLSLAETPEAETAQVESARACFPGKPLSIGPVTLKPRFNPVATGPEMAAAPDQLPSTVDPRQMSLFGAGWTLASLKYLAEAGVEWCTYFETAGWRGVLERAAGPPLPAAFRSIPGEPFPVYELLRWLGEFRGGTVRRTVSSDPKTVNVLWLELGPRALLVAANLTGRTVRAECENFQVEGPGLLELAPFEFRRWEVRSSSPF